MILGVTILSLAFSAFLWFLVSDQDGKMTSYVWGLLGYAQDDKKAPEIVKAKEQGSAVANGSTAQPDLKRWEAKIAAATKEKTRSPSPQPRSSEDSESTPKAKPSAASAPVPSFTLQEHDDDEDMEDNLPPPSFPAMNSAQRAGGGMAPPSSSMMPPPPRIPTLAPTPNGVPKTGGLMAPPPRPVPSLRPAPQQGSAAGLRVPTTGPLPNRNPPPSNGSLNVLQTTATKTPNPRQKVLLAPGHSPLDWATLKRSGKNLAGVDRLIRVAPSMLKTQNGRKQKPAWSSYQGKVYNLTPYLPFHPGGEGELRRVAGKDGAKLFHEVHPWVNWENMLEGCLVGIMVSEGEGEGQKQQESELDEMD